MRARRHWAEIKFKKVIAAQHENSRAAPGMKECIDIVVAGRFDGSGRLLWLRMLGGIAVSLGGRRRRRSECTVDFDLNATGGQGPQPRLGFSGSDGLADLELPSPNVRLVGRHDAILDAFVDHGKSPFQKKGEGLLFASAINPDIYGIAPAVERILRGPDMITTPAFTQKLPGCSIQDFWAGEAA